MSQKNSWVYFSDPRCLWDENLRQASLRVPEVMSELQKIQKQTQNHKIMNSLWFNEDLEMLTEHWQGYLFNVIQRGLFQRLKKVLKTESLVVIRSQTQLEALLKECDLTLADIDLWAIGPIHDLRVTQWMSQGLVVHHFLEQSLFQQELI